MQKFLKYSIKPTIDEKNQYDAKFTFTSLEKGFGVTLGNMLRRTMLANVPGASMFAIKIPGVTHEFQAMDGIKEDLTHVILNLKGLIVSIDEATYSDEQLESIKIEAWPTLKISEKGAKVVHASDIQVPAGFKIVNPDLYICTMENDAAKLNVEIYVTRGRGFKSFSANREIVNALSIIATDSNFSPIVRVAYSVDEEKISRSVTTDTLAIEVTTNGAITPSEAITYTAKLLTEYLKPLTEISENVGEIQVAGSQAVEQAPKSLSTSIEDLNLTIRPYNCLKRLGIQSIQQLTEMSKSEVEKIKNLGKKSVREITNRLKDLGLSLKASKSGF